MNFRDLIRIARNATDPGERPPSMPHLARRCGVSRAYLYFLMDGKYEAKPWTVAKIAKGLGVPETIVEDALRKSREEAAA